VLSDFLHLTHILHLKQILWENYFNKNHPKIKEVKHRGFYGIYSKAAMDLHDAMRMRIITVTITAFKIQAIKIGGSASVLSGYLTIYGEFLSAFRTLKIGTN
jgi:hypothetical protein